MTTSYEVIEKLGVTTILRNSDGAQIPVDPSNSDYQAYLKYIAENPVEDVE